MDTVVIRKATVVDATALFDVSVAAHASGYDSMIPKRSYSRFTRRFADVPRNREIFLRTARIRLASPLWSFTVAERDGKIIGYHCARRTGSVIMLRGLFVDPRFQRNGIGKRLFSELVQQFQNDTLEFKVLKANARAIALYTQFGFIRTRRYVSRFFGAPQIVMVRKKQG